MKALKFLTLPFYVKLEKGIIKALKKQYLHQGFHQVWYQGGVKATVSGVVEDLKFTSEGSDPNWCFPDSAQLTVSAKLRQLTGQSQENTNLGPNLLK